MIEKNDKMIPVQESHSSGQSEYPHGSPQHGSHDGHHTPFSVLLIGTDTGLFDAGSAARVRMALQARTVGEMHIIVFSQRQQEFAEVHDGPLHVYPTASTSRFKIPSDAVRIARALPHIDIISAQDPFWSGHIGLRAARHIGAKLQMQVHTNLLAPSFAAESLGNQCKVLWAKFNLRRADCVRVVSPQIKDALLRIGIATPISVQPIFTDVAAVQVAQAANIATEFAQFEQILLVAARLEKEKNVGDAIAAMPDIVKSFPKAGLLIAGDGSHKEALQKKVQDMGIDTSVVFLGRRSDIFSLYKGAGCCIAATAEYEGYGAATVEALAAGCPVISRDIGIAREAGAIIADRNEMAQKVIDVLNSGQRGRLKLHLPTAEEWAKEWYADIAVCCRVEK